MRSGSATQKSSNIAGTVRPESRTSAVPRTKAKSLEKENDPAADFLVGALLFSLLTSTKLDDLLPEGDEEWRMRSQ